MYRTLLKQFSQNITHFADEGRTTPLIGRYKELEKITQILLRRTKNNPILVGKHGVGKTAIVEGFAKKIVQGKVPDELADKQIISLDFATLIAGAKFREQFKKILNEIRESGNIVLFIDDIHTLINVDGGIDAIGILKTVLAQGENQCIAATTPDEYRKKIEQDDELRKHFQTIVVELPSLKEACYILRGLRHRYEDRHKLLISTKSLRTAVELSDQYIKDQPLPAKALNVIDRACYLVRLKNYQDEIYENIQERLKIVEAKRMIAEIVDNEEALSQLEPREAALQLVFNERRTVTAEHVAEVVSKMTDTPIHVFVAIPN